MTDTEININDLFDRYLRNELSLDNLCTGIALQYEVDHRDNGVKDLDTWIIGN